MGPVPSLSAGMVGAGQAYTNPQMPPVSVKVNPSQGFYTDVAKNIQDYNARSAASGGGRPESLVGTPMGPQGDAPPAATQFYGGPVNPQRVPDASQLTTNPNQTTYSPVGEWAAANPGAAGMLNMLPMLAIMGGLAAAGGKKGGGGGAAAMMMPMMMMQMMRGGMFTPPPTPTGV